MADFEYTPSEDARFDRLMDVDLKSAAEAREIIAKERTEALGGRALANVANRTKTPHHSRRGGRSYPEVSDSEADPFWNGQVTSEPIVEDEAAQATFDKIAQDAHRAAIEALARRTGMTELEAAARYKAQQEVKNRF